MSRNPELVGTYLSVLQRASEATDKEETAVNEVERLAMLRTHDAALADEWWAWEEVGRMVDEDPLSAFSLLLEIVDATSSEEELERVAAGHLEELIQDHGIELIKEIERAAAASPEFRKALSGIWLENPPCQLKEGIARLLMPPYLPAYRPENWQ